MGPLRPRTGHGAEAVRSCRAQLRRRLERQVESPKPLADPACPAGHQAVSHLTFQVSLGIFALEPNGSPYVDLDCPKRWIGTSHLNGPNLLSREPFVMNEILSERAARCLLSKIGLRLEKTPSRHWTRKEFGPGYMIISDSNMVVLGANHREYDASLSDVRLFVDRVGR